MGLENSLEEKGNLINKFTCFPTANRRGTNVVERNGELKQTGKTSLVETLKLQQVVWQYTVWIRGAISKSRASTFFYSRCCAVALRGWGNQGVAALSNWILLRVSHRCLSCSRDLGRAARFALDKGEAGRLISSAVL